MQNLPQVPTNLDRELRSSSEVTIICRPNPWVINQDTVTGKNARVELRAVIIPVLVLDEQVDDGHDDSDYCEECHRGGGRPQFFTREIPLDEVISVKSYGMQPGASWVRNLDGTLTHRCPNV